MDALLKLATDAGMTAEQGEAATGGVFALAKKNLESGQYNKIIEKIPEIDGLVNSHEEKTRGDGASGSLMSSVTGALGGAGSGGSGGASAGLDIASLIAMLGKQGISAKQINSFLPTVAPLIKKQCGVDISSILGVSSGSGTADATGGGTGDTANTMASNALGSAMGMFGKK